MPASQAAKRTPSRAGIAGRRAGANGDSFAAALAMALLLGGSPLTGAGDGGGSLLGTRAGPLLLHRASDLGIDVLDLGLVPQAHGDLLRLAVDHVRHNPVLDHLEGRGRALAPVVDPHDVPAELALERLADLAFLQSESPLLERRHHLPAPEKAELAALIL